MKKKRKLNLNKSKIASMNTLYSIKGGLTLGCNTENQCPKTFLCEIETDNYTCTCDTTILTVPLSDACTDLPTDDCALSDACNG
jgi:hypothetical protein